MAQTPDWNSAKAYSLKMDSYVHVPVPGNHVIMISFPLFDVPDVISICTYHTVWIIAQIDGSHSKKTKHCDRAPPATIYNTTNLNLRVRSDALTKRISVKMLFSFHNRSATPHKLPDGRWNCSVNYWDDFKMHLPCNLRSDCVHSEDEVGCPYSSDLCRIRDFSVAGKCFRYVETNSAYRVSWKQASSDCSKRGARLASLSAHEIWSNVTWLLHLHKRYRKVYIGLKTASSFLSFIYSKIPQWTDETMAYHIQKPRINFHLKQECFYLQAVSSTQSYSPKVDVASCDKAVFASDYLCEYVEDQNARHSMLERVVYGNVNFPHLDEDLDLDNSSLVKCPSGHFTHSFLACDVQSSCWAQRDLDLGKSASCHPSLMTSVPPSYACADGVGHVPYTLVCDHRPDCNDHSDELFCIFPTCETNDNFHCGHRQAIEDQISKETAQWNMYGDYSSVAPLFVSSILIGMKSDQIGRRFLFILPFIGSFVNLGIQASVIRFDLHYGYTLIGQFLAACAGGHIGMFFAGYALVSDTHGKKHKAGSVKSKTVAATCNDNTTIQAKDVEKNHDSSEKAQVADNDDDEDLDMSREKARTYKIVGLDVMRRVASSIISFATGYVIRYAGFFYSLVIVLCCKVLLMVFAYVFVTETGEQKKTGGFMAPLRIIGKALKDPAKKTTLILVNLGMCFTIFGFCDEFAVLHTYEMSPPFCLDSVQLGWLSSESRLKGIFAIPLMWLWRRFGFSEATIAAIGVISQVASTLVLATLRYMWVFFAVPAIQIPGTLSTAMAKAITSRLIGRSALASTFALMLAGEEVFWFGGSISANYMYQRFLPTLPTAPFYLASGAFGVAFILFTIQSVRQHRSPALMPGARELQHEKTVTK